MSLLKHHQFEDPLKPALAFKASSGRILKSSNVVSGDPVHLTDSVDGPKGTNAFSESLVASSVVSDDISDIPLSKSADITDVTTQAAPVPVVDTAAIRAEVMAEVQDHVDDLLGAISELKAARDSVIQSAESNIIELALLVAEKVIHKSVAEDATLIQTVMSDTFDKISGSDRIIFKVNPDDVEIVDAFQPTIQSRLVGVEKITIQSDPTIERGGCIIETDLGFIDVTIQEKLNLITQTFNKLNTSA
jgi:hypothetical protein